MDERTARRRAGGWYKSKRWQALRDTQLRKQPLCECRLHAGRTIRAEVVDHKIPHRGDSKLFFDANNLQSLAKQCHDSWKQALEKSGRDFIAGCDETGRPLDPKHHWNDDARGEEHRVGGGVLPHT
jgi:5-methylcytosine-specific restriction enzyme A